MATSRSAELSEVFKLLKSDKTTKRKDGLKRLAALLDVSEVQALLDSKTSQIKHGAIEAVSWPGLVAGYLECIENELQVIVTKKSGRGDSLVLSRTLRKLLNTADSEQRSGRPRVLHRVAGRLFRHFEHVLSPKMMVASQMGGDYVLLLRGVLADGEYAACSSTEVFQDLIDALMTRLGEVYDASPSSLAADEVHRLVGCVSLLLTHFPGDPTHDHAIWLADELGRLLTYLHAVRDVSKVSTTALSCVNVFLLKMGPHVMPQLPALAAAAHQFVVMCWRDLRMPRLRELLATYCLAQWHLGGLQAAGDMAHDMWQCVLSDLQQDVFKWDGEGKDLLGALSSTQWLQLQLTAALLHQKLGSDRVRDQSTDGDRPVVSKRPRPSPATDLLLEGLTRSPLRWAPVLATLVSQYGYGLVSAAAGTQLWVQLLTAVSSHLSASLPAGAAKRSATRSANVTVLWSIRACVQIANQLPVSLRCGHERIWCEVLQLVLAHTGDTEVTPPLQAALIECATSILDQRLAPLPASPAALFSQPPFAPLSLPDTPDVGAPTSSPTISAAAARFICTVLAMPTAATYAVPVVLGRQTSGWRSNLLQRCCSSLDGDDLAAAVDLSAAIARLLDLPSAEGSDSGTWYGTAAAGDELFAHTCTAKHTAPLIWLAVDGGMRDLYVQLQSLRHGEERLRCRLAAAQLERHHAEAQALLTRHSRSLPSATGGTPRSGSSAGDADRADNPGSTAGFPEHDRTSCIGLAVQLACSHMDAESSARDESAESCGSTKDGGQVVRAAPLLVMLCQVIAAVGEATAARAQERGVSLTLDQLQASYKEWGLADTVCRQVVGWSMSVVQRLVPHTPDAVSGAQRSVTPSAALLQLLHHIMTALGRWQPAWRAQFVVSVSATVQQVVECWASLLQQAQLKSEQRTHQLASGIVNMDDDLDLDLGVSVAARGAGGTRAALGAASAREAVVGSAASVRGPSPPQLLVSQPPGAALAAAVAEAAASLPASALPLSQHVCFLLLEALLLADADAVCRQAVCFWQLLEQLEYMPSQHVFEAIARIVAASAAQYVARQQPDESLDECLAALPGVLGDAGGLVTMRPRTDRRLRLALDCASMVAAAGLAALQAAPLASHMKSARQPVAAAVAEVVQHVLRIMHKASSDVSVSVGLSASWRTHVALAGSVAKLLRLDPPAFNDDAPCSEWLPLINLLPQDTFQARRAAGPLLRVLLDTFPSHVAIFDDVVQPYLHLTSIQQGSQLQGSALQDASSMESATSDMVETSMLALLAIAQVSNVLEPTVVLLLLGHAATVATDRRLALAVIKLLAELLGYRSHVDYLGYHFMTIAMHWFVAGYSLSQLLTLHDWFVEPPAMDAAAPASGVQLQPASSCLGEPPAPASPASFARRWQAVLCSALVAQRDMPQLQQLAGVMATPVAQLLQASLTTIMAMLYPYRFTHTGEVALAALQSPQSPLTMCLGAGRLDTLLAQQLDVLPGHMLIMASGPAGDDPEEDPPPPFFRPEIVVAALEALRSASGESAGGVASGAAVASHLLLVHRHVTAARLPRHRMLRLAALQAVVQLLGPQVAQPATARYLVHILMQQLDEPALTSGVCTLVHKVLDILMAASPDKAGTQLLATTLLQPLVSGLVNALDTCAVTEQSAAAGVLLEPLIQLLLRLTVSAPPELHPALASVELLPSLPQLQEACKLQLDARSRTSFTETVVDFVKNAPLMSCVSRQRALAALTKDFEHKQAQLLGSDELVSSPSASHSSASHGSPSHAPAASSRPTALLACGWALVRLATQLHDPPMAVLAGRLLAAHGLLDQRSIAFSPPCLAGLDSGVAQLPAGPAGKTDTPPQGRGRSRVAHADVASGASGGAPLVPQQVLVRVLRLLSGHLVHPELRLIAAAQAVLPTVLAHAAGSAALEAAQAADPSACHEYLAIYKEDVRAPRATVQLQPVDLATQRLWTPPRVVQPSLQPAQTASSSDLSAYDCWLCELTTALLSHAMDPLLLALVPVAQLCPLLCHLLLPHVMTDLVMNAAQQDVGLTGILASMLSRNILGSSSANLGAVRLFLDCLEHLRQVHREVVSHVVPEKPTSKPAKATGQQRSKSAPPPVSPVLSWPSVYALDIDYLVAAGAAVRAQAYSTALVYLEEWAASTCHGTCYRALQQLRTAAAKEGSSRSRSHQARAPRVTTAQLSACEALLWHIYDNFNEPDSIYALSGRGGLAEQVRLLQHEGDWTNVLRLNDLLIQQQQQEQQRHAAAGDSCQVLAAASGALMHSLHMLGCSHATLAYAVGCAPAASVQGGDTARRMAGAIAEESHEILWRLGQWDTNGGPAPHAAGTAAAVQATKVPSSGCDDLVGHPVFQQALKDALCALRHRDLAVMHGILDRTLLHECRSLVAASTESVACINPVLQRLMMLGRVRSIAVSTSGADALACVQPQPLQQYDFSLVDPLNAIQCAAHQALDQHAAAASALLTAASFARQSGHPAAGLVYQSQLQSLLRHCAQDEWAQRFLQPDHPSQLEEARLLWHQGQRGRALRAVQATVTKLTAMQGEALSTRQALALGYSILAKWSDQAQDLCQDVEVADVLELHTSAAACFSDADIAAQNPVACKVMYRLAFYADRRYKDARMQRTSPDSVTQAAVIRVKKQQIADLKAHLKDGSMVENMRKMVYAQVVRLQRPILADEAQQQQLAETEQRCLSLALANYGRCLQAGCHHDLAVVFRVCQLWFDCDLPGLAQPGNHTAILDVFSTLFQQVPSYKFLPLAYQLASRISSVAGHFQQVLQDLLIRLAQDHPFHVLLTLLALRNGNLGPSGRPLGAGDARDIMVAKPDLDKVEAAKQLLDKLGAIKPPAPFTGVDRTTVLVQMAAMVDAYVALAAMPVPKEVQDKEGADMALPTSFRRKLLSLSSLPVASISVAVDPSCSYDALPHVVNTAERISFVGGINRPKLIRVVDSAGEQHKQLVKSGNDDLRQDAVMQQFFSLVNGLLATEHRSDTAMRALSMVTYKVVPFSPTAGLVQWVDNTVPLAEYLLGPRRDDGAHARYQAPGNLSFRECYHELKGLAESKKASQLREAFDDVCARFAPVFHHFFLEMYRHPAVWLERRTTYTRSTAVASMAGYIIGLGDRHGGNILIDKATAQVVHIDLGIAFEQGRWLNTPELVPFRLTRDIVDGMGINGCEGVMRSCCEKTLQVLRSHHELLLTVIEVVLHDPLYRWAMTPGAAARRQHDDLDPLASLTLAAGASGNGQATGGGTSRMAEVVGPAAELGNADAERAVLRVRQKLQGLEGGEGEPRSVAGQVQALLASAQDHDNLSRMYLGWAAFV